MSKQYRKEKFESRDECLIWCADNKPIYSSVGELGMDNKYLSVIAINNYWQDWQKAIEIKEEKRMIEVWVNVYSDHDALKRG